MKGYDPACYELAAYFLPTKASARLKTALAQTVQDAIEDWMTAEREALGAEILQAGKSEKAE